MCIWLMMKPRKHLDVIIVMQLFLLLSCITNSAAREDVKKKYGIATTAEAETLMMSEAALTGPPSSEASSIEQLISEGSSSEQMVSEGESIEGIPTTAKSLVSEGSGLCCKNPVVFS